MTRPMDVNELAAPAGAGEAPPITASDPAFLGAVFDSIPGRAVVVGRDAVYRYANQEFLDFVGRGREDVLGRRVADVLGPGIEAAYQPMMARLLAGEHIRWEGWVDYGVYGRRFVQEAVTPWRNGTGAVEGIVAIARDLTDLKRQEQELAAQAAAHRAAEAYNAAIVETALDGIVVIDADGMVVDYNPAAEAMFGFARRDVLGKAIGDLIVPPEFRAAHTAGMARYLASGESRVLGRRLELEAMRADGSRLPIELSITDVTRGNDRLFAAHLRDLTGQRTAAAEIERQREALYQKEKMAALGSLLAGVAHELNNPLAIVLGQATLLREILEEENLADLDGRALAERCAKIEGAAGRCGRIVKSFLAMARQRKGSHQPIDLRRLVGDVVELLGYSLRTSGIEVVQDLPAGLPPVVADRDQLHQVVANLVINAHQALEDKGGALRRIRIGARHDRLGDTMVLSISDNGPGVPAAIRSRVFEPFFTTKPQGLGTGIGLAISRGLIEAHGGTLDLAESGPEGGATFEIRMPAGVGPVAGCGEARVAPGGAARRESKGTVLIVDDETDIGALLADMLRRHGFASVTVESGNAAVAKLGEAGFQPAAIFCDIRMPDGDGPFLHGWLSQHRPELTRRIAFLTGDALGPAAGRFLAACGCPVVEKPFTGEEIGRLLGQLVREDVRA